ncbi:MAG TPA: acyltransferase [Methylomirabilota bacterium]|nr:acyltransferase [Methylomirabilota bacterium]
MIQRNQLIDFLRGFAILVMILTHTTVFFPHDTTASTLWNWSHFAVPIFLFCSTYLVLQKSSNGPLKLFSYLKKRFLRLLIPYYIFLFFYLVCLLFLTPKVLTINYILQSIFLIGGVDINWLVLLFLYLAVLMPLFTRYIQKSSLLFWTFFILSFASTCVLLFYSPTISYKWIMWLPWSVMLYITVFFIKFEQKKKVLFAFLCLSLLIFIFTYFLQTSLHHSIILINNKYPPNLFYLSFGISVLTALTPFVRPIMQNKMIVYIFNFFSLFSYQIYFIHYLILTVLSAFIKQLHLTWFTFFLSVLWLTVMAQFILTHLKKISSKV